MSAESTPGESSKPKYVLKFRMPETPVGKLPRRFLKASDVVVAKPERVRKPLMQKTKRAYSAASGTPRPERAAAARAALDMLTAAPGTQNQSARQLRTQCWKCLRRRRLDVSSHWYRMRKVSSHYNQQSHSRSP